MNRPLPASSAGSSLRLTVAPNHFAPILVAREMTTLMPANGFFNFSR